jgi:epoxyqueuosine reductase
VPDIKETIRSKALELGFLEIGFAKAEPLVHHNTRLSQWLASGYNAGMGYMARNQEMRLSPKLLQPGAKTVISLLHSYYPPYIQEKNSYLIAKYAYGQDYHGILREKLNMLLVFLKETAGCTGRGFTDSAPIMERQWAQIAGLGWTGKNSLLISPKHGSFVFISELVINKEIEPDIAFSKNMCGSCTACIDACPTKAIVLPGLVDSRKCISYLTIEHKGGYPEEAPLERGGYIFGCDICQDCCPWNNKSAAHDESKLAPNKFILGLSKDGWENIGQKDFTALFKDTAIKRCKYDGLARNISAAKKEAGAST